MQAFVPADRLDYFACGMNARLGEGSCMTYGIAQQGAYAEWSA